MLAVIGDGLSVSQVAEKSGPNGRGLRLHQAEALGLPGLSPGLSSAPVDHVR